MKGDRVCAAMETKSQRPAADSPAPKRKKIKLPDYKGLRPPPRERVVKTHPTWLMMSILAVVLVGAAAFLFDTYRVATRTPDVSTVAKSPAELLLGISSSTNRYVDPLGRFSIGLPAGWQGRFGDTNVEYDALLTGPAKLKLYVMVAQAPGETIDHLKETFRDIEAEERRVMNVAEVSFQGRRAISRSCKVEFEALSSLDFMDGETSFHLMGVTPRELLDSYKPVITALMETLKAGKPR